MIVVKLKKFNYKTHYLAIAFLILFVMPSAFADVDLVGVDIFCDNEILLGFTGLIPFLDICPIQGLPISNDLMLNEVTTVQTIFEPSA